MKNKLVYGEIISFNKLLSLLIIISIFALFYSELALAETNSLNTVSEIISKSDSNGIEIIIKSDVQVTYTAYELFNPARIVVDIANAQIAKGYVATLPKGLGIELKSKEISDAKPQILRLELYPKLMVPYTVRQEGEKLLILLSETNASTVKKETVEIKPDNNKSTMRSTVDKQLPNQQVVTDKSKKLLVDDFNFSGYSGDRVSIDFYKMDLHNVFRFLREISGVNIVVDEAVNGSLTLALNDVPWDFALDIILNLKDLKKEERFNTIVIYPKNKEYAWPKNAENSLSFEADPAQEEGIVITQFEQQPPGLVEATQFINEGREFEKQNNPIKAAESYEKAFAKWDSNTALATKISSIYLVQLRQNAKALHFAKEALRLDKNNRSAALNAAIASANMRDNNNAENYFEQTMIGGRPSQEALLSYALFREDMKQFDIALKILEKNNELYGNNLDAMIGTARIYDKKHDNAKAIQAYKSILNSGYTVPPDLARFINARLSMSK